jgi:hypothetical protein
MLRRAWMYFQPHLFGVAFGLVVAFLMRAVLKSGGSCTTLCYPPVTIAMGLTAGLLGAQIYRSDNPLPPGPDAEA